MLLQSITQCSQNAEPTAMHGVRNFDTGGN
jgi:hypothetical protein